MEKIKEFFGKVGEWLRKFWKVILIPVGFFVVAVLTHGNRRERLGGGVSQVKDDIKELNHEIKADEKELRRAEKELEKMKVSYDSSLEELEEEYVDAEVTLAKTEEVIAEATGRQEARKERGGKFIQ